MNIHFYTASTLDANSGNPFEGGRPECGPMLTEDAAPPEAEDDDVDPFAELGVAAPAATTESAGDALEAFFEEEDESEDSLPVEVEESEEAEDEDDEDPFATLGVATPAATAESAGDALEAFFDEDDDEDEAPVVEEEKEADLDDYRMVLQTVWVDGILDPAEVALLARRRAESGISFAQHLDLVRELLR